MRKEEKKTLLYVSQMDREDGHYLFMRKHLVTGRLSKLWDGGNFIAIYGGTPPFAKVNHLTSKHKSIWFYEIVFTSMQSLQNLQETEESFKKGAKMMGEGHFDQALSECTRTLNKLDEILCPPYRDYIQCQEGTRRCMLTMGNRNFDLPSKWNSSNDSLQNSTAAFAKNK